jgi:hypothetical protein
MASCSARLSSISRAATLSSLRFLEVARLAKALCASSMAMRSAVASSFEPNARKLRLAREGPSLPAQLASHCREQDIELAFLNAIRTTPRSRGFCRSGRLTVIFEEADPEFDDPVAIGRISGQGARTRSKPHMGNGSSGE